MGNRVGRIEYLDVAKGIGILLVVFGHVVWGGNYDVPYAQGISNFIYSFHMPLFFVVSGLCIRDSKQLNKTTVMKMVKAYLVPYAIWTVIYMAAFFAIDVVKGGQPLLYLLAHAVSLCGLAPLWFLLALFIAELIVLAIKPLLQKRGAALVVLLALVVASIASSLWYSSLGDINLFLWNYLIGLLRILPTTFFVAFGYIVKERLLVMLNWKMSVRALIILVAGGVQLVLCVAWDEAIDVQLFNLANPFLYFIKSLNGTFVVLMVTQLIHSKLLVHLGSKTKELMILHYPPFYYTVVLRFVLGKLFEPNLFGALVITAVTIACCLLIDYGLSRFTFWNVVMGKKITLRGVSS